MATGEIILLAHAGATFYMVGLIWFVQIVHYPLFAGAADGFPDYEVHHARLTARVVLPAMLTELGTGLWLVVRPPEAVAPAGAWTGLSLLALVWWSTFVLQVPRHRELARGFDRRAHQRLVRSNWVRTVAWSLRGLLVVGWLVPALKGT